MKTTEQYLTELQACKRRIRWALAACTAVFAAAALCGFLLKRYALAAGLALANLAFYFLLIYRMSHRYGALLNQATIEHGLCRPMEEAAYLGDRGLPQRQLAAWAILPMLDGPQALLCRNGFVGRLGQLQLGGHEITLHYPLAGARGRANYRFVSGSLLTAHGPDASQGDWLLLRQELVEEKTLERFLQANGYHPAAAPVPLKETFGVYSHTPGAELPDPLAQRLTRLDRQCRSLGAVRLAGADAAVFLNRWFYAGSRYTNTSPTEEMMRQNRLPERDSIWSFFRFWAAGGA